MARIPTRFSFSRTMSTSHSAPPPSVVRSSTISCRRSSSATSDSLGIPMFNGQRYRAHNAVRRSARDLFFRSSREKPAGRTSTGRYSTFAARAIRRRQSEKLASQWIHANVATGLQSRTAFCSDRDDSISGASDPKFSKVFADTKPFQDLRSSARLRRDASSRIS